MADIIQVRRDTAANWTAENPTLAEGEIGLELDTGSIKFGDGATDWVGLAYFNAGGGGGGTGDVTGPASAVADRIAVFSGTTGKQIKDGGYTIAQLRALALATSENVQTGTSYTLVLADAFRMVAMNNAGANSIVVPPDSEQAFPNGIRIDLSQDGAGQTTITAGSGVTIRTPETLKLRKQWGKATLIKRATNTWDLEGNLEAAP